MTSLRRLDLAKTKTTDAGLGQIEGLTQLQCLDLGKNTTDAGLVHLKGLTNLKILALHGTRSRALD